MRGRDSSASKRGAILGVVLIVVAVASTLGTGMIALNGAHALDVSKAVTATEAFWTAEAGLELAKAIAGKNRMPLEDIPQFAGGQMAGTINGRQFTVTYPAPAGWDNSANRVKRYNLTSTGFSPSGVSRQVMVEAEIQTYASYMHASNYETTSGGSPIYFGNSDRMDGTVYVNDTLNIYGHPEFLREAFSASDTVNYQAPVRTGVDMTVFQDGLTLGAQPLDFSDRDQYVDALQQAAGLGGITLNGTYRITFNDNATLTHQQSLGGGSWAPPVTVDTSTGNGAIYVSGDAYVSGEVRGSLTLAARSEIFIEDDLTYATATTKDHSDMAFDETVITDALGLIATDAVVITSRTEVNVHGSILVTGGGFGCEGRYEDLGEPSINLFGGLTQYRRGVVGQLGYSYWEWRYDRRRRRWYQVLVEVPARGFAKNYRYDDRLLTQPPAQFPYSAYDIEGWRQTG